MYMISYRIASRCTYGRRVQVLRRFWPNRRRARHDRSVSLGQLLSSAQSPPGFGFIEFESSRDAEDAVHHFNGKNFMGAK